MRVTRVSHARSLLTQDGNRGGLGLGSTVLAEGAGGDCDGVLDAVVVPVGGTDVGDVELEGLGDCEPFVLRVLGVVVAVAATDELGSTVLPPPDAEEGPLLRLSNHNCGPRTAALPLRSPTATVIATLLTRRPDGKRRCGLGSAAGRPVASGPLLVPALPPDKWLPPSLCGLWFLRAV